MKKFLLLAALMLAFTVSAQEVTEHTYAVAGTPAALFGMENDWDEIAAPEMTLNEETGLYEWTSEKTELGACTVEFKVVKDHVWHVAYPPENYVIPADKAGTYSLYVTYNPETNEVTGELTQHHTYAVAGTPAVLYGMENDWDQINAPEMTYNEETGLYEWTSEETKLGAGLVAFKVVQDHAWYVAYPPEDFEITAETAGYYILYVTYNEETNEVTGELIKQDHTYAVTGTPAALFGIENEWDPEAAPEMVLNEETGLYEWVSAETKLAAGNIEFKVVRDHNWDVSYPEENYVLPVEELGCYVMTVTYNFETDEVNAYLTQIFHNYAVTGTPAALFGIENEWDPEAAPEMTYNEETGLYEWVSAENKLAAGNIEFKVVRDHNWEVSYPEENYVLPVEEAGFYVMTVTYNFETDEVNAYLTQIFHNYAVTGTPAALFGIETEWDPEAAPEMVLNEETGLYEWTSEVSKLAAGNIEFKVVRDHNWEVSYPEENYVLPVDHAGAYTLFVTYNEETNEVNAILTAKVYMIGEVNGNVWATNVGVDMTTEDGVIYTSDVVLRRPAAKVDEIPGNKYCYFSFAYQLMDEAEDWDGFAPYRFGAMGGSDFRWYKMWNGVALPILTDQDPQAIEVEEGDYTVTVDLANMTLTIEGESLTGIENINSDSNVDNVWYNIAGQKFNGKPSVPGIYINNGKKVIIK